MAVIHSWLCISCIYYSEIKADFSTTIIIYMYAVYIAKYHEGTLYSSFICRDDVEH